jgi:hypothetical protein
MRRRPAVDTVPRLLARFTHGPVQPIAKRDRTRPSSPPSNSSPQRRLTAAEQLADLLNDPSGRRARRGIPLAGNGGLDERRDPLLEVLARDDQRTKRKAALEHLEDGPYANAPRV